MLYVPQHSLIFCTVGISAGFDAFKEELGPSRDSTLPRGVSLDVSYDEQDMMKVRLFTNVYPLVYHVVNLLYIYLFILSPYYYYRPCLITISR